MQHEMQHEDDTIFSLRSLHPGGISLVLHNPDLYPVNPDSINSGVGIRARAVLAGPGKPSDPVGELYSYLRMISRFIDKLYLDSVDDVSVDPGVIIRSLSGCVRHPRQPPASSQVYPVL